MTWLHEVDNGSWAADFLAKEVYRILNLFPLHNSWRHRSYNVTSCYASDHVLISAEYWIRSESRLSTETCHIQHDQPLQDSSVRFAADLPVGKAHPAYINHPPKKAK